MNPLDKIKEGIEKQDWGLVCKGYNTMTGHNLPSPPKSDNITPIQLQVSLKLFKSRIEQMFDEFEFVQTAIDEIDTVVEPCDEDKEQPTDDDEKNVDFDEVTSDGDKVGLYGNTTVFITEQPKQSLIEANKKFVENRGEQNPPRPPPRTYDIKCTDCQKLFESRIQTGEFGQKCPKCLRSTSREH